ncbi:MAG: head GIN domain-containing protein [Marinilabiliaceae bacterium]
MKRLFCFLVLVQLFMACDYMDGLTENGEQVRKTYDAEGFERIILDTSVRLVLTNEPLQNIEAEGPDFAMPRLKVFQEEDELHIESDGIFGFRQKQMPVVRVGAENVQYIRSNLASEITNKDTLDIGQLRVVISGSGSFTECDLTVKGKKLDLSVFGSNVGDHRLAGEVSTLRVISEGLTSVDAAELITENATYHQRSVNPGYVYATGHLKVEMSSSGNIYYRGNPETEVEYGDPLYETDLGNVIDNSP